MQAVIEVLRACFQYQDEFKNLNEVRTHEDIRTRECVDINYELFLQERLSPNQFEVEVVSKEPIVLPKESIPKESIPKESIPKESIPKESIPKEAIICNPKNKDIRCIISFIGEGNFSFRIVNGEKQIWKGEVVNYKIRTLEKNVPCGMQSIIFYHLLPIPIDERVIGKHYVHLKSDQEALDEVKSMERLMGLNLFTFIKSKGSFDIYFYVANFYESV